MTKFLSLILGAYLLLLVGNNSLANGLVVNFEGNLLTNGCKLSDDALKKEITLPNLRFSTLENLGRSDIQPFQLDIVNCTTMAMNKTIKITLSSEKIITNNGISYVMTNGVTNILLALTDNEGKELKFNVPIDISKITQVGKDSVNTLLLGVYAKKPWIDRLKPGDFSALVTFNLDYI
ncbi:MAG TPA: type 1 fimbrial protein [Providencia sp.]|uniref:fimbrial protein n=1 Tax=Providencia sp. TaxID=589 RepID=UPI000E8E1AC8|nr:fimbrial protein [Providencia sp.]MBP6081018.1 type 1 fimbrial protein [Providencia sp.]HBO24299.1 type 1 fimbrial protein [Providencia sp.]